MTTTVGDSPVEETAQVRLLRQVLARNNAENATTLEAVRDSYKKTLESFKKNQQEQLDTQRAMYEGMLDTERMRTKDALTKLNDLRQVNASWWYHLKQLFFG